MNKLDPSTELSIRHVEQYIEKGTSGTAHMVRDIYRLELRPAGNDLTAETATTHPTLHKERANIRAVTSQRT